MSIVQKMECHYELARMDIDFHMAALMFDLTKRQTAQRWRRIRERYIKEHPDGF
jgi:hypothetical protein